MTAVLSRRSPILLALTLLLALPPVTEANNFRQLTTQTGVDRHPCWTPDGEYVIYESASPGGDYDLWRVPVDGGTPVQLTDLVGDERMPEVSPDGSTIAFTLMTTDPVENATIWTVPIGGGAATQISTPSHSTDLDWHASWTPDGDTIYFSRRLGNDHPNWDLYKVKSTGGPTTLVYATSGIQNRPHVSHDGTQLLFEHTQGTSVINVVRAPIGNPAGYTPMTTFSANTSANDWSPDDAKICFSSRFTSGRFELFEMDVATQAITQLTFDVPIETFDPNNVDGTYSPDGRCIAFTSRRQTGNDNIWVLDLTLPQPPVNQLDVVNAVGLPGGSPVPVTLTMTNVVKVRGLEFHVSDMPEGVTLTGVSGTGRGDDLEGDVADDGTAHVLAWTDAESPVPTGTGAVLELSVQIDPGVTLGSDITISLSEIILVDDFGGTHEVGSTAGTLHVARRPGDVNGDNAVNSGDLIRVADIIFGRGTPATPEELEAADCTNDDEYDIRDIVCLTELIVPSEAPAPPVGHGPLALLAIESIAPVRAIEFDFPRGTGIDDGASGLHPFDTRSWVRPDGSIAVQAWDMGGGLLPVGELLAVPSSEAPIAVRAWGANGQALTVALDGRRVTIGGQSAPPVPVVSAAPTPFDDATTLRFRVERPGTARIDIFDVRGALRRSWSEANAPIGDAHWTWDGRDSGGAPVASGVYFARIQLPGSEHRLRLIRQAR